MERWFHFEVTRWRVMFSILALFWFVEDMQKGWFLLPTACLSFFIYSPEQKLRRPRPRMIPYVTPSALIILTIALGLWANEFPSFWYPVPIALIFFYRDNETEKVLQWEKERYLDNQNVQNSEIDISNTKATKDSLISGVLIFLVGAAISLVCIRDLIFAGEPGNENMPLGQSLFVMTIFGVLPIALGIHHIIRTIINKPIAAIMDSVSINATETVPVERYQKQSEAVDPPAPTGKQSDFVFQQISALAPPPEHCGKISSTQNILNVKPLKMLMLWNFKRTTFGQYRTMLGGENWQQIGPLYMLSSPSGLSVSRYFQFRISNRLERAFIQSDTSFKKLLAQVDDGPINHNLFSWAGRNRYAYPIHNWMCLSDTWKNTVYSLCEHVDAVILDARAFNADRIGLTWEIACLVDNVNINKFVVLTDPTTALDELRDTFSNAWKNMSADSPNQNTTEGIRVLHGIGAMHFETHKRFPEPFHRFEASQVAQLFPNRNS